MFTNLTLKRSSLEFQVELYKFTRHSHPTLPKRFDKEYKPSIKFGFISLKNQTLEKSFCRGLQGNCAIWTYPKSKNEFILICLIYHQLPEIYLQLNGIPRNWRLLKGLVTLIALGQSVCLTKPLNTKLSTWLQLLCTCNPSGWTGLQDNPVNVPPIIHKGETYNHICKQSTKLQREVYIFRVLVHLPQKFSYTPTKTPQPRILLNLLLATLRSLNNFLNPSTFIARLWYAVAPYFVVVLVPTLFVVFSNPYLLAAQYIDKPIVRDGFRRCPIRQHKSLLSREFDLHNPPQENIKHSVTIIIS